MSLEVEPPKKKNSQLPSPPPSFSSLPYEIAENCLARIPISHHPKLSLVSKTFLSLVSSTELYKARSRLGSTEQCLYVSLFDTSTQYSQWFRLWINPNRTLDGSVQQLLVPVPSSNTTSVSKATVAGSEIYLIGGDSNSNAPSSAVRVLDCRSHTWRDPPSMNVARKNARTCVYDGKIYVMGGVKGDESESSFAEVFDIKTQTWECLPNPAGTEQRKCYFSRITEIEGKIRIENGKNKKYAYDIKQGKWECVEGFIVTCPRLEYAMMRPMYYRGRVYPKCQRYRHNCRSMCCWYDIKAKGDGAWKEVKGLESLMKKYNSNGGSSLERMTKLVSCGGKLFMFWEGCPNKRKKICCAEIVVEKRNGGREIWGKVEWVDVVRTVPASCQLLQCVAVDL